MIFNNALPKNVEYINNWTLVMLISKKHLIRGYRAKVVYKDKFSYDLRFLDLNYAKLQTRLLPHLNSKINEQFVIEPVTWEVEVFSG